MLIGSTYFRDEEPFQLIDYFNLFLRMISIIGIYGYSFQKNIFKAKFWKIFLPFIFIWDTFITIYSIENIFEIESSMLIPGLAIFYIIFYVPVYIGLYLYSYKYQFKTPNKTLERNSLP